jgi:DNA-directed RNA polymerase subunit M/transcription elongation factor TFIIS
MRFLILIVAGIILILMWYFSSRCPKCNKFLVFKLIDEKVLWVPRVLFDENNTNDIRNDPKNKEETIAKKEQPHMVNAIKRQFYKCEKCGYQYSKDIEYNAGINFIWMNKD